MTLRQRNHLVWLGVAGLLGVGALSCPSNSAAQARVEREGDRTIITPPATRDPERDPIIISPGRRGTEAERESTVVTPSERRMRAERERDGLAAGDPAIDPETGRPAGDTPRTDRLIAQARADERERTEREMRSRHRDREGEVYVGGFGGATLGNFSTTNNVEGRGAVAGQTFADPNLQWSAVYGLKIGYFHPGRLNWLGLEVEGYHSNPHIKQSGLQPGSHMRLSVLGLNAIARTRMACRDDRRTDRDDPDFSPLHENARCPLQAYVGAGLGVFFAETNNQFGRSTENARAGLNALAGVKYFFNEHLAIFAEYKFNYVDLKFDQFNGSTAGANGTFLINHVVGGLAVHF
jgi:hypothetical protein